MQLRSLLAALIVLLGYSPCALADHGEPTPHEDMDLAVPATSSTGDYAVTWMPGTRQLQERKVGAYSYTTVYEGTSPKAFTNKGDGTYYYRVRKQFCKWGECTWYYSEPEIIVVSNATPPGQPGSILGPATVYYTDSGANFTLTWSEATGSVGEYELGWRKNGGTWGTIHASSNEKTLIRPEGTYDYRVRACNDAGCSAYTAVKTVEVIYLPLPGVPGDISGPSSVPSADDSATFTLTWGEASGTVDEYELERRIFHEDWQPISPTTPLSRTEFNLPYGLYRYRVRACNGSGCSDYTGTKSVNVVYLALPGTPGAISGPSSVIDATGGGTGYDLNWTEASGTVDTYKLRRRKNSGTWTTIQNTEALARPETAMTAGTYQYRVSACNGSGCGAYTAAKSVQVIYQPPPGVPGAISVVPSSTLYDSTGNGAAYTLSWGPASGTVTHYELQRNGSTIQSGIERSRPETMPDGIWQYRVRACNSSGCSDYTAVKSVEVIYLPPPGAPGSISGPSIAYDTTGNGAGYVLSWDQASGTVSRYELQRNGSTIQSGSTRSKTESGVSAGAYNYRVRACNAAACGPYTAAKSVDVVTAIASAPPSITPSAVGTTSYGIDVAGDGDAVVTVPLRLIDGIAGFAPALWLEYDSGRGVDRLERSLPEDTIGYGWRLAGLSHIRRCVVNQSSAAAIQLDSSDSLCLNGMPLVRASGSHLAVGAIYRTLLESYIRIEVKGSTGALWFEATLPDGTVQEYGKAHGSRVDVDGGTDYQWSINKATDVDGNVITYTWHRDIANGINYIASIDYAGAGVDFGYSPRTDTDPVSIDSASQEQSVLLHTVRVRVNGENVREYFLFDEAVDGRRRLDQIQQCGYDEGGLIVHCLEPLDFAWTTPGATIPGVPILVSGMTDGLGANHLLEYGTITDGSEAFLFAEEPFGPGALPADTQLLAGSGARRFVATKLRRDDGLGGYHDTSYAYQGVGVESTRHWGFLGFFAQRITDEASGLVTYAQFRLDYPHFGRLARVLRLNATLTQTIAMAEWGYAQQTISHAVGSSVYPYLSREIDFVSEGASALGAVQTEHALTFSNGFVSQTVSTVRAGTGATVDTLPGSTWGDVPTYTFSEVLNTSERTASFTNRTSGGQWLINFPNAVTTESWPGAPGGSSIVQDVTMSPRPNSVQPAAITRFPNDTDLTLTTAYGYDNDGHLTSTTVSGDHVTSRTTTVHFENPGDRYPDQVENAEGHTTTFSRYDERFGNVAERGDPNGKQATWERDPFGRLRKHTNGDGVESTTVYGDCATGCSSVNGIVPALSVTRDSEIMPLEITYYDKLGRVLRYERESLDGSHSKRDFAYDNLGRLERASLPYFSGAPNYVVYGYDNRNRVTSVQRPDGSTTTTSYSASADRVIETVTEVVRRADGTTDSTQVKRNQFNILGQLVETTDGYGSSDAVTTAYTYDANGNLETATVDGGISGTTTTTYEYDAAGNRKKIIDPDIGTVSVLYTALGQPRARTDNMSQTTTFTYDLIGRLTSRTDPYGENEWEWDPSNGSGKLGSRSGPDGFEETYSYNAAGKLETISTEFFPVGGSNKISYVTSHTYDQDGRPYTTAYPGGFELTRVYNSHGYLSELRNGTTAIQTFNSLDAFGHSTHETYGNGVETARTYNPETGLLTDIDTSTGSTILQDNQYDWRSNRTLESRTANQTVSQAATREEVFTYDVLNRLTTVETYINSINTRDLSYAYDALGNIVSKTSTEPTDVDVTNYTYGYAGITPGPHGVWTATITGISTSLTYNGNGAVTRYDIAGAGGVRWLSYNAANQPTRIVIGSGLNDPAPAVREDFRYDPNGRRYAKETTWQEAGGTRTEEVHYVGNVEIAYYAITDEVNKITKTRISPNVMHVKASGSRLVDGHPRSWSETHFEYAHRDHLGSIEVVTDESGATLHDLAFDPFGLRKQSDWSGSLPSAELDALMVKDWGQAPRVRGFTGHEHLDRTGFIHMNGRVYDPVLGRFVSPDPFVQFPGFSQSWNRYSYVNNTPTSFTDPTGYFEDLHGTGGTTNEDGYGGTVGAWGRARANATWAGMMPPPGLVNCPDEHSGLCLNPFPDSLSTNGVAGMSSKELSGNGPEITEIDVDMHPIWLRAMNSNQCLGVCHTTKSELPVRAPTATERELLNAAAVTVVTIPVTGGTSALLTSSRVVHIGYRARSLGQAAMATGSATAIRAAQAAKGFATYSMYETIATTAPIAANPAAMQAVLEWIDGMLVPGPPPMTPAGAAGAFAGELVQQ